MGTETPLQVRHILRNMDSHLVKLNNPLMGTETVMSLILMSNHIGRWLN